MPPPPATIEVSWLILLPLLPLIGFLINGLIALVSARSERAGSVGLSGAIGTLAAFGSFIVACFAFAGQLGFRAPESLHQTCWTWFSAGGIDLTIAFRADHLSTFMLLFVTGIGSLIHLYSIGYMRADRGFARFMAYLNLFLASMIILVLGDSLPMTFLGWEGVGLCSYLLIGFWHHDHANNDAARKAFIMNRIGDLGFILAMGVLVAAGAGLEYEGIATWAQSAPAWAAGAAGILIFLACTGKSAQLPLFTWLPDAMAGPTPVSALIHAATMVTAGVYLMARCAAIFAVATWVLDVVLVVAALTALYSAVVALFQWDIKKVLAYSTVSQLGFMFMAVGVGAFDVALFHVFTHAFFKGCLFLGAGQVIDALHHEQDMRKMGALAKKMPVTYHCMAFSWLAIIGIPPAAGFFSKDLILERLFHLGTPLGSIIFIAALIGVFLTALYMTRMMYLVFWGTPRNEHHEEIREVGLLMNLPTVTLAAGSLLAGVAWSPIISSLIRTIFAMPTASGEATPPVPSLETWLHPVVFDAQLAITGHVPTEPSLGAMLLMALPGLVAVAIGWVIAHLRFGRGRSIDATVAPLSGLGALLTGLFDRIYVIVVVKPLALLSLVLNRAIEEAAVPAIQNAVARGSEVMGLGYRCFQRSRGQLSLLASVVGLLVIMLVALWSLLPGLGA